MRALGKKTAFGRQVAHTSWLMYEFTTMQQLYQVGAAVPKPVASNENAILMSYHGDAELAAPTLAEIRLEPDEVKPLFEEVLHNIELMLERELVHGDLSAYNVLYWDGEITLIDFPQVVNIYTNVNAYTILERDITRICEYFARQGLEKDPTTILDDLWARFGGPFPDDLLFDESL
jgi:RIO kinase 1